MSASVTETSSVSPAFSIGGPENPDIDGWSGRIITGDVYIDGGTLINCTIGGNLGYHGTLTGTVMITDITPGSVGSGPSTLSRWQQCRSQQQR